jgi:putative transposase
MIKTMETKGCSQRRACVALKIDRSSMRYENHKADKSEAYLVKLMTYWAMKYKKYGYRRVEKALRKQGHVVNHKKIYRLWTTYGLTLLRKKRRKRGVSKFIREINAQRPNHVWSYDFMFDRTQYGVKLKILNIVDEYSREALSIKVGKSIQSSDVVEILLELIVSRGMPEYIRSDNGSEFTSKELQKWAKKQGINLLFIKPGHPWENGFVESFNGKLREECLNMEILRSKTEAQVIVDQWKQYYNTERMHSSLGYKTPEEHRKAYIAFASTAALGQKPQQTLKLLDNEPGIN